MICISAVYPNAAGSRFDPNYYISTHARFAASLLKPRGLFALRLTTGKSDLTGAAPLFWAISEMHFDSLETFHAAMAECGAALFEDAKNYTDVNPLMQISTLHD